MNMAARLGSSHYEFCQWPLSRDFQRHRIVRALPCFQHGGNSLLPTETADIKGVAASSMSFQRGGMNEVGFDHDLLSRKTAGNVFLPCKLGDCNVSPDPLSPCASQFMNAYHGCNYGAGGSAVAVACMHYTVPGQQISQA